MSVRPLRLFCVLSCLMFAATVLAQEGHPVKGTWVGYWGPTAQENRVVIVMDYDGKNISGVVNPGVNAVPIKTARMDIKPGSPPPKPGAPVGEPSFTVHIEAEGKAVSIVADGAMQDVALPNRSIAGSWTQTSGGKAVKGEFKIRRQ